MTTAPRRIQGDPDSPDLCIVVPAFNEETNLPVLVRELDEVMGAADIDYHLVVVDDGSRDGSREVLRELCAERPRLSAVFLSRNFGHQAAVSVGLQEASGRAIAVMDADLQDKPSDVVSLYRAWQEGADVAYAVRRTRKEGLLLRTLYRTFYRLLHGIASVDIPLDSGDFCVMDGAFVERLNALPERQRYVRGLRAWLGGNQVAVPVDRDPRRSGEAQYTFSGLLKLAVDGFVSFSFVPLRVASYVGTVVSLMAFVGVIVVFVWRFTGNLPTGSGLATIALSVLFLGGVQLLTIGILGEYIGRTFDEVKARPVAVVGDRMGSDRGIRSGGIQPQAYLSVSPKRWGRRRTDREPAARGRETN